MAIRKDANTLSPAERQEFVDAVRVLKATGIYDQFVLRHANAIMTAIHRCPAFLPWHRRFIWDFEQELQRVSQNPDLGLPYWNWPAGGVGTSLWDDDFLGGNGDPVSQVVTSGPFRAGEWAIVNSSGVQAGPLTRAFGRESWAMTLPTGQEIEQVLGIIPFDNAPWNENISASFRNQLEGFRGPNLHNRGHGWVGGSMLPMTSPNDPIFFLHHCMVDKLWHEWQLRFPNQGYLPMSGGPFGQNLTDPMNNTPAGAVGPRPIDVLDSAVLGIEYDQLLPATPAPAEPVPAPGETGQAIEIDGTLFESAISAPGEVDLFRFEIPAAGQYIIETAGPSDTFMTLYGPNDPGLEVAADDDGGDGFNSRIERALSAGTYHLRIRLFSAGATGSYSVSVGASGAVAIPRLIVGDPPHDGAISAGSESDIYRFEIASQGTYTVETEGSTDTFLTLFGPDSQTAEIGRDDDSGVQRNARITRELAPGEYFARIRHFSTFGTGPYRISVRSG